MFSGAKAILGKTILSAIALSMIGCSLFPNGTDWIYHPMYPHEILTIESGGAGTEMSFEIASFLNTPCHKYSHADVKQDNFDIFVEFYQKQKREAICTQVIVDTRINWSINMRSPGEYRFHFWQSDSTSLDTIVIVQ